MSTRDSKEVDGHDPLRTKTKVAVGTAGAFVLGLTVAAGLGWSHTALPEIRAEPQIPAAVVQPALDISDAFVNIAEVVTPAVVRIEAESRRASPTRTMDLRGLLPPGFDPEDVPTPEGGRQIAGGTGFLVTEDGYILTNDHVVAQSDRVTVWLHDGRYFPAEVVGSDPFTDVAVIKIEVDGEELPTLSLGDSDGVRVGQWVLAVGNPGFGRGSQLDYTVTQGIISARSRGLTLLQNELSRNPRTADQAQYAIEDFLQTDAVINPGNSGGPMVDLQGRVIGINSAIASQTGFYQGYGFAIPINLAHRVMEDLIEYGYVKRPIIGVSIQNIDAEDAEYYGLPSVAGAEVNSVTPGGPADRAGLQQLDVIVAVEGEPVGSANQLQQRVAQYRPGERITVTIYRDHERRDVEVLLGEQALTAAPEPAVEEAPAAETRLGFEVRDMSAEEASQLGLQNAEAGVYITDVRRFGPADRQNIRTGLRIVEIQRQPISSAEDVRRILESVEEGEIVNIVAVWPNTGQPSVYNVRMPTS